MQKLKLEIVVASEGGVGLEYLNSLPIPEIFKIKETLGKILDEANKEIKGDK